MAKRFFKDLGDAKAMKRSKIVVTGSYVMMVRECLIGGRKDHLFIVELGCLDAWDVERDERDEPKRKAGDEMAWMANLTYDSAMGNIKGFCLGLDWRQLGLDEPFEEDDVDESFGDDLIGPDQPARNVVVEVTAFDRPQKEDPSKMFTYLNWRAMPPEEVETFLDSDDGARALYNKWLKAKGN